MPHAQKDMVPQVNGEKHSSAFITHLTSFPIVHDSIVTYKSNPYGRKSLDMTYALHERFGKTLLAYLSGPYQYVSPYVEQADAIGDSTLSNLETRFPVVQKPTHELYDQGKSILALPMRKGSEGKQYITTVYNNEIKRVGGQGYVAQGKAAMNTGMIVGQETLSWFSSFWRAKANQAKEMKNERASNVN